MRASARVAQQCASLLAVLLASVLATGCASSPGDFDDWRAAAAAQATPGGQVASAQALRAEQRLREAHAIALRLAAERPDDPLVLFVASVAESDALVFLPDDARGDRAHAAWSALDFAERALQIQPEPVADTHAQHARAIGATIHLRSMFARAEASRATNDAIAAALALDPTHPEALAVRAMLRLRLATLPWIARAFASDLPEATLEQARADAEAALASRPSAEHRLLLADVLDALDLPAEADAQRAQARAAGERFPRDRELLAGL